jgi:hypothetical protein
MDRLLGKGLDKEFATYCDKRVRELQNKKREVAEDQRLRYLSQMLHKIQAAGNGL